MKSIKCVFFVYYVFMVEQADGGQRMLQLFRKNRFSTPFKTDLSGSNAVSRDNGAIMGLGLAKVERTVRHSRSGQTIGRVKVEGVSWQALCVQDIPCLPGTLVVVKYRHGNTLIVDVPNGNCPTRNVI